MIIRLLTPEDAALVRQAAEGVFDYPPKASLTAEFLGDPRHHLVAALEGDRVMGFVSAVHYVHPDKPAELWINEVAVAPDHQNHGIGRQMLEAMLSHGRHLGCGTAWVLTEETNPPAMRLYAGASGAKEPRPCVMFEFDLGRD